jgi:hypothetical protein
MLEDKNRNAMKPCKKLKVAQVRSVSEDFGWKPVGAVFDKTCRSGEHK